MGRYARVDLTSGKVTVGDTFDLIPEEVMRQWIGGRGLGVYLMLKEVDPKVDPLSPENKAFVLTGPVTGVAAGLEAGRWTSVTKSPLTNTVHDSQSGGHFGPYMKFAGFDLVILEGASDEPVYLVLEEGKAELRDAKDLWGKDTHETTRILEKRHGKNAKVACIGPAGERLSLLAAIINDMGRAAGRGAHGAVWGSKKLKAIVAVGSMKVPIGDEQKFQEVLRDAVDKKKQSGVTNEALPNYGTAVLVNIINQAGIFPTRNFQEAVFEEAENLSGERIAAEILLKKQPCWGCIIACGRFSKTRKPWAGIGDGPEYETVWALGANTGTGDLDAVTKANFLCNELGMDTIETGNAIAVAMELYEKGAISEEEKERLDGVELNFGNPQAVVEMTWRAAYRSGFGDDISLGGYRLAKKYGKPEFSMHVRGQSLPAYDPRGVQGHALGYATSNRGGCHLRAYMISPEILGGPKKLDPYSTEGKAELLKEFQDVFAALDSMVVCKFVTFAYWDQELAAQVSAVTGWDMTPEEFRTVGERIYNAERAFNAMAFGDGEEYDTLPDRLTKVPIPGGPSKGHVAKLGEMLPEYYQVRGWVKGRPTRETLERLGLKEVADRMEQMGVLPS
ncbi:MAG: aldehyde ferredoxin oxidoreductase family protein [Candidatus Korarchaeota archaeon]|nr:aldehyde ferredoxin oxidoreductase family protein [Candidatus Korarchaeota archaeon]